MKYELLTLFGCHLPCPLTAELGGWTPQGLAPGWRPCPGISW